MSLPRGQAPPPRATSAYETLNTIPKPDSIEHARCSLLLRFLLVVRLLLAAVGIAEPLSRAAAPARESPPSPRANQLHKSKRSSLRGLVGGSDFFQQFDGNVCKKPTA